jgi:tubulin-specific chaperone C
LPTNEEADKNQWDQVDDFKWLKADHSPNWSLLPEQDRIPEEVWTKVVPGGPETSIDGILRKVGVTVR